MMAAMKDYFSETLEEEPWSDVEATLWYVVQRIPLFSTVPKSQGDPKIVKRGPSFEQKGDQKGTFLT